MSSKLLNAALAALLLGSTGLALADNDGRGKHRGGGDHRAQQERGWNGGAPRWNAGPPHGDYRAPAYPQRGHDHWKPGHGWKHGHRHHPYYGRPYAYHRYYPKPHADFGDDITIIFRGRLD
jgi:hypothetical protein